MRSHISNQEWKLQPTALGWPRCRYTLGPMIFGWTPIRPGDRVTAERIMYHDGLITTAYIFTRQSA
jgi:hypothetical protein